MENHYLRKVLVRSILLEHLDCYCVADLIKDLNKDEGYVFGVYIPVDSELIYDEKRKNIVHLIMSKDASFDCINKKNCKIVGENGNGKS